MSEKLNLLGNTATIVAALAGSVAAIAAIVALSQFRENLNFEKDKLAIEMFTSYRSREGIIETRRLPPKPIRRRSPYLHSTQQKRSIGLRKATPVGKRPLKA